MTGGTTAMGLLRGLAWLLASALLAGGSVSPAAAASPAPFGHPCIAQNAVRFCATTTLAQRVPTFDGVPLDVDVTLPPTGVGPWPTIVMLHGFGQDKTDDESTTPAGDGGLHHDYNNVFYAQRGYAVVNFSDRGQGNSCANVTSLTPDCARGRLHLADQRYEARDAQYLLGRLVDEGIAKAGALGATGFSYGGGLSLELAYLKARIRLPDGSFAPWKSHNGTALSITAA